MPTSAAAPIEQKLGLLMLGSRLQQPLRKILFHDRIFLARPVILVCAPAKTALDPVGAHVKDRDTQLQCRANN